MSDARSMRTTPRVVTAILLVTAAATAVAALGGCRASVDTRPAPAMPAPASPTAAAAAVPSRVEPIDLGKSRPSPQSLVGRFVRVQFRRDALGLSATAPLPADATGVGGRNTFVDGTLTDLSAEWVVLASGGKTYWIPQHAVLMIEAGQ